MTAQDRRQEKLDWTLGWCGGFIWVLILSLVFLFRGDAPQGLAGLLLCAAAGITIAGTSPWRHPQTPYRVLMLPIYALLLVALAWADWSMGDLRQLGINGPWSFLILLPAMLPLWVVGDRRWSDSWIVSPSVQPK